MVSDARVVYVTCPSLKEAEHIAETVVNERLAACVNIFSGVMSVYLWQGTLEKEQEVFLLIKTMQTKLPALQERLLALHSYTVPEFIALPILSGSPAYLQWIEEIVT
jgi:periplasmic divalent cation tolerance protein